MLIERPTVTAPPPRPEQRTRQAAPPPRSPKPRLRQRLQRATQAATRAVTGTSGALRKEFSRRRRPLTRTAAWLQLAYLVSMVATWIALITLSERWLPATLLTYGPRVVVLLPLVVLVPQRLLVARRSLLFTVAGALVATTQIMGFRISTVPAEPPPRASSADTSVLRLITLNTAGGRANVLQLEALIARHEPDVIMLQECRPELAERLGAREGWHAAMYNNLCTVSRWPLGVPDSMPRAEFARVRQLGFGGTGLVVRYAVAHPTRAFFIVNLHLSTARDGLESLLGSDGLLPDDGGVPNLLPFAQGGGKIDANTLIRSRESERAAQWAITGTGALPVFVAGDFNLPVESSIYRRFWHGYVNAFEHAGRGFGYTKAEGKLLRIRIDHVLAAGGGYVSTGAWLGPEVGSDHRPVIADFTATSR